MGRRWKYFEIIRGRNRVTTIEAPAKGYLAARSVAVKDQPGRRGTRNTRFDRELWQADPATFE